MYIYLLYDSCEKLRAFTLSLFLCSTALEDQKRHEKLSFLKMD